MTIRSMFCLSGSCASSDSEVRKEMDRWCCQECSGSGTCDFVCNMLDKPQCKFIVIGESFRIAFDDWLHEQGVELPEEYSEVLE